ncbi:hypothetical protein HOG17_05155 [Candidatus Peregrinibacteria bacterium]|jgi:hypothetical protein|nr:hypothetical protein [Candidatus Peregrinibacteria bacterium]MBT4147816.1 hypothetical protein [Candidatus Peregrinibacteria bacterium]MBT4366024.1 hypothetical protein [Candidatus Peregrinibacteria bacterium]MBT4455683.1 hypothetical protein [Candidatus Peregrinibacteria bacterium]
MPLSKKLKQTQDKDETNDLSPEDLKLLMQTPKTVEKHREFLEKKFGKKAIEKLLKKAEGGEKEKPLIESSSRKSQAPGSEIKKLKNYDKAKIEGPKEDTKLSAAELADLYTPRTPEDSPFGQYQDLSGIRSEGEKIPEGRRSTELYTHNEEQWLKEIHRRIINKDIDENTLVVAISGHGPTVAHAMAQHFHSDIYCRYPEETSDENMLKVKLDQMQSFAKATNEELKKSRKGSSTFIDVDIHQTKPIPQNIIDSLPSADQLIEMGITKIFIGQEKAPNKDGPTKYIKRNINTPPLTPPTPEDSIYEWLNKLIEDGRIQIIEDGIDIRHLEKMKYKQGGIDATS